jgi:hypothetical protein
VAPDTLAQIVQAGLLRPAEAGGAGEAPLLILLRLRTRDTLLRRVFKSPAPAVGRAALDLEVAAETGGC